jgi:hypothetical protein
LGDYASSIQQQFAIGIKGNQMAVTLSPFGGVAAQFFDNSGNLLSGGLIYTYAAGTSNPQITYTTSSGSIAQANPIVLDASGRVPSGEIWLSNNLRYKFVLQNSLGSTIATYDNIIGSGSLIPINFTGSGTTTAYSISGNVFSVYINGVYQNENTYSVSGTVLTFTQAPPYTSLIEILTN